MSSVWIAGNGVTIVGAIVCMAYVYHLRRGVRDERWPWISIAIIGATALVTGLQFVFPEVLLAFRRDLGALREGEWWRVITPLFVQPYGWPQVASNAFLLITFMPLVEKLYGRGLWAIYFIPGVVGQAFNYAWIPVGGGSSTAAFAVIGALLAYVVRYRAAFPLPVAAVAVLGLLAAVVLSVARDGHGPAVLLGVLVAAALRPEPPRVASTDHPS